MMGEVKESKGVEQRVFLPPCKICGDQAAGFHYGVNTCEACKGFFHRSLGRYRDYKCRANRTSGYCEYKPGKRKSCQYCRYQKCLEAGMSKGAIKTGRYTYIKRTQDTTELQRLQGNNLDDSADESVYPVHKTINSADTIPGDDNLNQEFQNRIGKSGAASFASSAGSTGKPQLTGSENIFTHAFAGTPATQTQTSEVRSNQQGPANEVVEGVALCCEDSVMGSSTKTAAISTVTSAIDRYKAELINRLMKCYSAHLLSQNSPHGESLINSQAQINSCCVPTLQESSTSNGHLLKSNNNNTTSARPISSTNDSVESQSQSPSSLAFRELISSDDRTQAQICRDVTDNASGALAGVSTEAEVKAVPELVEGTYGEEAITLQIMEEYINTQVGILKSPSRLYKLSPVQSLLTATTPTSPTTQQSPLSSPNIADEVFYQAFDQPEALTPSLVPEMFQDRDGIISLLAESHRENVRAFQDFNLIPKEELRRQQYAHYETCTLKNKTFGRLDFLPEKDYDEIYSVTGMDIDNRRRVISNYLTIMEKCVRGIVQFAKSIPGFSNLDINTQVELIKASRSEFSILTKYPTVNLELGVTIGLCGHWICKYESDKIGTDMAIKDYMKFADDLQKLDLAYEEVVLLKAITVMTTDRETVIVSPLAEAIRWELCQCLLHCLRRHHVNPMRQLARYISALTQIRTVSDQFQEFLKSLKLDKYSSIDQNPLLVELFSSVIHESSIGPGENGKRDVSEEKNICILPAVLCSCQLLPPNAD